MLGNSIKKFALSQAFSYIEKDPIKNLVHVMDMVDKFAGDGPQSFPRQRKAIRDAVTNENSTAHKLVVRMMTEMDLGFTETLLSNFFLNASITGWKKGDEIRKKYNCNVPWAILLDPTSACNLHCKGCWAAEYGNKLNLTYDEIDGIIRQGKEMGTYFYIYTGGEPLVRKKDLIKLCEAHSDAIFMCFTNGTLIDEQFAADMMRVKNFVPVISVEGYEEAMDSRRGDGTYQKAVRAMNLLKSHRLPFGNSICYTSANIKDVSTEAYVDQLVEWGSYFAWYFHYMPWARTPCRSYSPPPSRESTCTTRSAPSAARSPSSCWTSRTTASTWAAASPAAGATCTSTPRATVTPACSSTTPTPTSGRRPCWRPCAPPCSRLTTTGSPSTTTTCAPAPCWRTPRSCGSWSTSRRPPQRRHRRGGGRRAVRQVRQLRRELAAHRRPPVGVLPRLRLLPEDGRGEVIQSLQSIPCYS